jgi:hypothetical protein
MQRGVGIVLVALGGALLWLGLQRSDSVVDRAKNLVTGSYTDRTNLYLAGGGASVVAGLLTLATGKRREK